ncbi:phage tail terminator-like protein [Desulfolutivibrio sp.]|uniref:phage tail terminator-like protein n=1 Tax=Desulfolutivibrio sp. TaxID=2773296 RepID=UPI002F96C33E
MKQVSDALNTRLNTFATAQGLLVAWQNADFTPPEGTYLKPYMIPGSLFAKHLGAGGLSEQRGIYYVNIISPLNMGVGDAQELADAICQHFPRGLELSLGDGLLPLRVVQSHMAIQREEETCLFTQIQVQFYTYR